MRLLYCDTCSTLEEVPDLGHELEEGEVDPFVFDLQMRHYEKDARAHGAGNSSMEMLPFRLLETDSEAWKRNRQGVIDEINVKNKQAGFTSFIQEAMNTYEEDAGKCYNQHRRPTQGCIDWRDDSKIIGRPTEDGKKAFRERPSLARQGPFLCDYCVVRTYVQTEVNFKKGLYKENS